MIILSDFSRTEYIFGINANRKEKFYHILDIVSNFRGIKQVEMCSEMAAFIDHEIGLEIIINEELCKDLGYYTVIFK